jgi:hypothetical protein
LHQPWRTRQCPVPRLGRPTNWPISGILRAQCLKITELSGVSPDCPVRPRVMVIFTNSRLPRDYYGFRTSKGQRQSTTSGRTRLPGVPPDCPVHHKDRRSQWPTAQNPNGRLTWHALDNEQWSVRCAPDCLVCPLTKNTTNG